MVVITIDGLDIDTENPITIGKILAAVARIAPIVSNVYTAASTKNVAETLLALSSLAKNLEDVIRDIKTE